MSLNKKICEDFATKEPTHGGVMLEINMNQIFSVNNLDEFVQVQQCTNINFAVNMLKEIEPVFNKCQNLRILDLSINHISHIENIDMCVSLEELNLSKNQIQEIKGIDNLSQMKFLNLSMNKIKRIGGSIRALTNLERLYLYGNQIEFLEGLDNLTQLSELLINRNKLTDLNYLSIPNLETLTKLNASYNEIREDELDNISHLLLGMPQIRELDLYGNQICNNQTYKFRLTENSSLERLDGLDVKGIIRDRLDRLRKDWQINQLIEETSEEAKKWIEAERELKASALSIIARQEDRIKNEFDNYRKYIDNDVQGFIEYISELKMKRTGGNEGPITFQDLENWKSSIKQQEGQRINILESQLQRMEERRRDMDEATVSQSNFLDSLHQIAMNTPDVWASMKADQYRESYMQDKGGAQFQRAVPRNETIQEDVTNENNESIIEKSEPKGKKGKKGKASEKSKPNSKAGTSKKGDLKSSSKSIVEQVQEAPEEVKADFDSVMKKSRQSSRSRERTASLQGSRPPSQGIRRIDYKPPEQGKDTKACLIF